SSLAPGLRDDLFRDVGRDLRVAVELHRVHRTTLGLGPQVADVPEHLRQRDESTDDLDPARVLHRLDLTSPGVQVADDISHVLLRSTDLDVHERLEEDGLRLAQSLLGSHGAGDLERHLRGVDVVVGTVQEHSLDVHDRVAGHDAALQGVLDARVHARDVLARDAATGDLVLELVEHAVLGVHERAEGQLDLRELAGATGLLLVGEVELLHRPLDGLAVGDLRLADVRLDVELAAHAVHEHVDVELAHALDDRLAGLLVQLDLEGGVLLGELLDRDAELLLVALGLGLDGHGDHGVREGHRLELDRVRRIGQGVTGGGVLQTDERVDVAREGLIDGVLLVGVHLEELPDALLLAGGGVEDLLEIGRASWRACE